MTPPTSSFPHETRAGRLRAWLVSTLFTMVAVAGFAVTAIALVLFFPGTNRVVSQPASAASSTSTTIAAVTTLPPVVSESSTTTVPESTTTTEPQTGVSTPVTVGGEGPLFAVPLVPYRVARGDTLESIAAAVGSSVGELAALNGIAPTEELGIGTVLLVPGGSEEQRLVPAVLASDPDRARLIEVFQRWAEQYGVPPELLMAVAWVESEWDQTKVGPDGEIGVMQLTPELAQFIGENIAGIPLDPTIEAENIQLGAAYLGWLLDETEGDTSATLAAYFDGLTSQRNIPWREDTVEYISEVLALRPVFDPRAAVAPGG